MEEKFARLQEHNLHSYERFCLSEDAEQIPADFIIMLSILKQSNISTAEQSRELLLEAIQEKMDSYITHTLSDKRRSR